MCGVGAGVGVGRGVGRGVGVGVGFGLGVGVGVTQAVPNGFSYFFLKSAAIRFICGVRLRLFR